MRIFDHPNLDGFVCPICGTSEDKPVTLVGILETLHDGIMQAKQIHVDCIDLLYDDYNIGNIGDKVIYHLFPELRK